MQVPFDRGNWKDNFAEVFGDHYWLLPVQPFQ
jgi:hypothetical protein